MNIKEKGCVKLIEDITHLDLIIVILGCLLLLGTSGGIVKYVLAKVSKKKYTEIAEQNALDTGFVIGKCENLLILAFILLGAYTALALIFAAKTIVRGEDIKKNSLYFLTGTMINVTYSIIIGLVVKTLVDLV